MRVTVSGVISWSSVTSKSHEEAKLLKLRTIIHPEIKPVLLGSHIGYALCGLADAVRYTGNKFGLFMLKITLPRLQNEAVMRDYSQTVRRHTKLKKTLYSDKQSLVD